MHGLIEETWCKHMTNALLTNCTTSGVVETMDKRLKQLVMEAQRLTSQTDQRQQALTKLVDEILRSRKICRSPRGQSLSGVYQEIYQLLREQLLLDVDEAIEKYNPQRTPVMEWAKELRDNLFRKVLDDTQLKKLALVAQQHPPNTELQQQALIELVNALLLSGRLCRPHRNICSVGFYELIYEEAVNQTLVYVCQKIDNYNPSHPETGKEQKFITWVNFTLDKLVLQCYIKFKKRSSTEIPNLNELENIAQPEYQPLLTDAFRECLENDVNNMFKKEHVRNSPSANFQAIALATLAGKSWEEISEEFGIKVPTLSSFFRRCCQKFAPVFQEYV